MDTQSSIACTVRRGRSPLDSKSDGRAWCPNSVVSQSTVPKQPISLRRPCSASYPGSLNVHHTPSREHLHSWSSLGFTLSEHSESKGQPSHGCRNVISAFALRSFGGQVSRRQRCDLKLVILRLPVCVIPDLIRDPEIHGSLISNFIRVEDDTTKGERL